MILRLLADFVVVLHFAFIVFVMLGALLVWRWGKLAWVHIPCAVWGAQITFTGWICPLTPLEKRLREAAGVNPYPGGFVEHYILPLIYPPGMTREIQIGLGFLVISVNVVFYGLALRRRLRRGRSGERRP